MSQTKRRIDAEIARCTRATATRVSRLESRSSGQTVNPMSIAPSPKHVNENPVAKTRQARSQRPAAVPRTASDSLKRVGSLDLDQQFAPADVSAQHQRFLPDREQFSHLGQQAFVIV